MKSISLFAPLTKEDAKTDSESPRQPDSSENKGYVLEYERVT